MLVRSLTLFHLPPTLRALLSHPATDKMDYETTKIDDYHIKVGALEAWAAWRFEGYETEPIVQSRDGHFLIYAAEKLTKDETKALKKQLRDKKTWIPPPEPWEEWWERHRPQPDRP
ncbi:hypothetical protein QBC39DRAFT_344726 [Podospora conica]|nr:hypothetical protein QBC39DRAFT_344726 [Schizothecium conicum]